MRNLRSRARSGIFVLFTVVALALTSFPSTAAAAGRPGDPGLGDYLFPDLGNGGYDARHYTSTLRYGTASDGQVAGKTTMKAVATQDLSSFNLDFAGDSVSAVTVNGRPAVFDWQAPELTITPARSIRRGCAFEVEVIYAARPITPAEGNMYPVGWVATPDGSFTAFQPDAAHRALPVNDHPSDKATWDFVLDVPRGVTAITNGVLTGKQTKGDRTVWRYAERSPIATELLQIAVDEHLSIKHRDPVDGVAYRDAIADKHEAILEPAFAHAPELLRWVISQAGPYPHAVYGNIGVNQKMGYALETQGLSLQSPALFDKDTIPGKTGEPWFYESVEVHEMAHEYYGNSVSPARWSDVWLNEGWATLYMKLFEQEHGTIDEWGNPSIEDYMREVYSQGDVWRAEYGPVARPSSAEGLFSPNVYDGGALVLWALKQKVGDEKFTRITREWPRQYRDQSASTDQFIRFASRVSGQDLRGFLSAWLYGDRTPAMPGHPDWTVEPVTAAARTAAANDSDVRSYQHGWGLAG